MKRFICLAIFIIILSNAFCEELKFVKYQNLNPEINLLKYKCFSTGYQKKPVILATPRRQKYVIEFDMNTEITRTVAYGGYKLNGFFTPYWNPISKKNIVIAGPDSETPYFDQVFKYNIYYEVIQKSEDDGFLYDFEDTGIHREADSPGYIPTVWVSDESYYMNNPYDSQSPENSILVNKMTNQRIDFSPERIIGYGEGIVLTSIKQNEKGLKGISIWSESGELLYKDSSFDFSDAIDFVNGKENLRLIQTFYDSFFEYPYLYINLVSILSFPNPTCSLIMNVETQETFVSPYGYRLLAVF